MITNKQLATGYHSFILIIYFFILKHLAQHWTPFPMLPR
jgi:hypothetical protein